MSDPSSPNESDTLFGDTHIQAPLSAHTHTAIILHGRGDTAASFASDLLTTPLSAAEDLSASLPGWRFVFPSAPSVWSAVFEEHMPSWFEAASLADPSARQDLQASGLRNSVEHVRRILEDEITVLSGERSRVVLGGISQGGAVGMWTLLSLEQGIGGFFGVSTWLPFAQQACGHPNSELEGPGDTEDDGSDGHGVVLGLLSAGKDARRTPVLMCHGVDDAYVDVDLGRQAAQTLREAGFQVSLKEYEGAEQEGHWFKVPEGLDDIQKFLAESLHA